MASITGAKTVLITGGNRGLGKSLVQVFAGKGWNVLATARKVESLPPEVTGAYALDLSNHVELVRVSDAIVSKLQQDNSKIDLIIHNAGFNPKDVKTESKEGEPSYFDTTFYWKDFSAANVGESMLINALHPMEFTGRLMQVMSDACVVVAVSSWLGSIGTKTVPGHYGYTGSKALMNMFIKGMSIEFAKSTENRAAIALNPGWMKTDMGGGDRADIAPDEVARRLLNMFDDGFLHESNGAFLNTDRTEHAW